MKKYVRTEETLEGVFVETEIDILDCSIRELSYFHNSCKCDCKNCFAYSGNKENPCIIENHRLYSIKNEIRKD